MNDSKTRALLARAVAEPDRVRRHLLVAAALRETLSAEPIVVGGLAEDYYTGDRYNPTDLGLCAPFVKSDERTLVDLGFRREDRHWYHENARVAVEFPDSRIDGDESRTELVDVGGGAARLIGLDDLYLDRLRQATMTEAQNRIAYLGAVAIAASRFEDIDWVYVRTRIRDVRSSEPETGAAMAKLNRHVRTKARTSID